MARGRQSAQDQTTLQMALIGYEIERQRIEGKIREIQAQLGQGKGRSNGAIVTKKDGTPAKKRILSAAARRRIAAAQRKRWAEHRKKAAAQAKA